MASPLRGTDPVKGGGRWSVLIPVGPAPVEVDRLRDLFDALHTFEPDVTAVVLVDDGPELDRDLLATTGPLRGRTTVITNPRDPSLDGWSDGLTVGIRAALRILLERDDVDWVIKMDTDALVIGEFSRAIGERFAGNPWLGLVGSHDVRTDGTLHPNAWPRTIRKHQRWVSIWRPPNRLIRASLFGVARSRRLFLRMAQRQGYRLGEACQGGAYALSLRAARAMEARGWFDDGLWLGTRTSEDVVMAMEVRAAGFSIAGMVGPGEPFAIRYIGLDAPPGELVAAGHGVVHSLKSHGGRTEEELRDEFRSLRRSYGGPALPLRDQVSRAG